MLKRVEIVGKTDNRRRVGSEILGESCPELEIRAAAGDVAAQQKLDRQKATGQCGQVGVFATEILGGAFVGQDEREANAEGSRSDRAAMRRRTSKVGYNSHRKYT